MTAKTSLFAVTALLLAVALGWGWFTRRSAREAEVSLAALAQDLARQEASLQHAQQKIAAHQADAAALRAKLTRGPAARVAPKAVATPPSPPIDPATRMESDPKFRELYLKQWRANLPQKYRLMYQRLGLTQAQIDKFEELAAAHEDDLITLRAAARAQGFIAPPTNASSNQTLAAFTVAGSANTLNPGLEALIKQSDEEYYARVAREIGGDVSTAVVQNDRIGDVHAFVSEIDIRRPGGALDLTGAQAAQLSEILLGASPTYQKGGAARLDDINWDKTYDQAAALLPAPQFRSFKARADFYNLGRKVREFRAKQKAGSP